VIITFQTEEPALALLEGYSDNRTSADEFQHGHVTGTFIYLHFANVLTIVISQVDIA